MIIDKELIEQAKEKLGDRNAEIIAEVLELEEFDMKNLKSLCCFHKEDSGSFVYDKKKYRFKCFGCGELVDILDAFMRKGSSYIDACKKLFEYAEIEFDFKKIGKNKDSNFRYPKYENGDMSQVYSYLGKRGISQDTIDYLGITSDSHTNICFNYYGLDNRLTLCKYRPSHSLDKDKKELKAWCQKDASASNILYNMTRVKQDGTLVICEGEIDCASFIEAGWYQVCSVPLGAQNLKFIDECWDFLMSFDTIIFAGDNDEAGKKMIKEACTRLGATNTKYIEYPMYHLEKDGEGNPTKKVRTKDANDVLQKFGAKFLFNLVLEAKESPINAVARMSEIEEMNVYEMDGVKTGLKLLDKELMKLFTGGVTLLTGLPSSGKTTFLNQIVLNSMDENFPVFLFSRELLNGMSLGWLNNVAAGRRNMKQVYLQNGDSFHVVVDEAKKKISNYYNDKLYIYKDEEGNDAESLFNAMIMCARRRGVKCFVIDNLLTVDLSCDESNKNNEQTKFMNRLIRFSIEYNVIVLVVAHPRKVASGQDIGLFDVAGSSNIVNLATRTISLRRISEKEKDDEKYKYKDYDVIVSSVKDRIFGSTKDIPVHYDKISRRFFCDYDEYDYQYAWDDRQYQDRLEYAIKERENPFN